MLSRRVRAGLAVVMLLLCPALAVASPYSGEAPLSSNAYLRGLDVRGSSIAPALQRAAQSHVGAEMDADRLQALARTLDSVYAQSDVAIYSISLHAIDENGSLPVVVREAYVQSLRFDGLKGAIGKRVRAVAQSLQHGSDVLGKRRLHRTLRLIEAIPGAQVEATMVAGTAPGGLEIRFEVTGQPRQAAILLHNNGQSSTGRAQLWGSVQGNGVLRAGDQISLQYGRGLEGRVQVGAMAYSMPFGTDGLTLDLSGAISTSYLPDFALKGEAYGLSASLSYPLLLTEKNGLTASLTTSLQVSETRLAGFRLLREETPAMRATLRWKRETSNAISDVALTASHSLPFDHVTINAPLADRHFAKVDAQIGYARTIGKTMVMRVRAQGQYSSAALTQAEGVALGGQTYGRAYDPAILIGDSAAAASAEIIWAPFTKAKRRIELFGAADAARAYYNERLFYRSGHFDIASLGGGARVSDGRLNADIGVYRAMTSPYPGYEKSWRALVNVGFSFP